ncbi:MAG: hypothetical protein R3263_09420, partial [Myxococcota bacterium]|nr:hypothetical protein [Myxococcota bacterium]
MLGLAGVGAATTSSAEPAASPAAAGLRAGLEALEAGRAGEAVERFAAVAKAHPVVADHAERLRLRALAAAGEPGAVRHGAAQFVTRFPDSPVLDAVWRLRAEAAARQGDEEAARAAWREARSRAPDVEARAAIAAEVARSLERDGRLQEAASAWAELFGELAATPAAEDAPAALARLEEALGHPLRTTRLEARRARALYDARDNEGALAAAERALAGALPPDALEELARLRAFTLFRLRRYARAAEAFAALGDDGEARLYHARSLARSG